MPPRPRGSGAFGSKMVPKTSPSFRPRAAKTGAGFSLRTKIRLMLLSTTLASILLLRLYPPVQTWLQVQGAPGRLLVLVTLCLPTALVLLTHTRKRP